MRISVRPVAPGFDTRTALARTPDRARVSALGRRPPGSVRTIATVILLGGVVALAADSAHAQQNCGQFGGFCRAQAAQQMIVVGVQQGISSLPPTSGQSFSWTYDTAIDTYVRSDILGPMSFRTPQTVGRGRLSVRLALSYFELAESFGPITYEVQPPNSSPAYAKLGTSVDARVGLINLAFDYGILEWLEVTANLPIPIVDAHADNLFSTRPGTDMVAVRNSPEALDAALQSTGPNRLTIGSLAFDRSDAGFRFNEGTHVGVGRIAVGAKARVFSQAGFELAPQIEFYCPSPSQDEFSGTDTPSLLGRLIAAYAITDRAHLHADAGYDYDFDLAELRRFTWDAGASYALGPAVFDAGFGGSLFDQGIQWTPPFATAALSQGGPANTELTALGDTRLGTNYIDLLIGMKVEIARDTVLGGTVNVPVTSDGLRADAVGTVGVEYYF